jgi:hypothetical protein
MAAQTTSWKQSDIFPLIAHVIAAQFQQHQRFITSREIAVALLRDSEARRIIDGVVQQRGSTPERTAINMVAWFSQRITAGQSEWQRMFERTRINSQYTYKPVAKPNDQATPRRVTDESP